MNAFLTEMINAQPFLFFLAYGVLVSLAGAIYRDISAYVRSHRGLPPLDRELLDDLVTRVDTLEGKEFVLVPGHRVHAAYLAILKAEEGKSAGLPDNH